MAKNKNNGGIVVNMDFNKKRDVKAISAVTILIVILVSLVFINSKYTNKDSIELSESIIAKQAKLEEKFEIKGFTLERPNVVLDPYDNSPLTALVIFETEKEVEVKVVVEGKDELTTIKGHSPKSKKHYVPIYGLYGGQSNNVTLEIEGTKKTIIINTETLPEDLVLPTNVKINDKEKLTSDLYFFTPASKGYTSAYDVNGDVRWYLKEKMAWDIDRLENGRLLLSTERSINPPYFTTGLYETDLLGKVYNEFSLPGGYHHDFFEMDNGNLLIASNDFNNEDGTVEDVIVEIDRKSGMIVATWDLKEVLNMKDGKSENWSEYDWFHNNSVWYDKKENVIILSGRHQDAVIAIDYDTSKLKWIIGDPTGWSEEYQKYFFEPIGDEEFEWQWSQHAAMVTPEGYIFILDNGNNKSKIKDEYVKAEDSYTRGVMYDINTEDMTIKQVWQYGKDRGSEYYSPYISDVDYIDKNHYIVHSGGIVYVDGKVSNQPAGFSKNAEKHSTTTEIIDDMVVFELTLPNNLYRAEKMNLYNNSKFELGEPGQLGLLGETESAKESIGIPNGLKDVYEIDSDYESHKITFANEKDRLVMNGTFEKYKTVNLILYKNLSTKEYPIRITNTPYTALCINVFSTKETDKNLEINKYINKEGLQGKHSVYLEIKGKVYNTGKVIDFE